MPENTKNGVFNMIYYGSFGDPVTYMFTVNLGYKGQVQNFIPT